MPGVHGRRGNPGFPKSPEHRRAISEGRRRQLRKTSGPNALAWLLDSQKLQFVIGPTTVDGFKWSFLVLGPNPVLVALGDGPQPPDSLSAEKVEAAGFRWRYFQQSEVLLRGGVVLGEIQEALK